MFSVMCIQFNLPKFFKEVEKRSFSGRFRKVMRLSGRKCLFWLDLQFLLMVIKIEIRRRGPERGNCRPELVGK